MDNHDSNITVKVHRGPRPESQTPDIEHRCGCGNDFMRPHTVMMRHGYGCRVWFCNNCDGLF